nr:hypothetical protein [Tanacetum cinerariifolium]
MKELVKVFEVKVFEAVVVVKQVEKL